jgi:hypothetical protein
MFVSVPNNDMDFHRYTSWFFLFIDFSRDADVRFHDFGCIVDYHCLIFHFLSKCNSNYYYAIAATVDLYFVLEKLAMQQFENDIIMFGVNFRFQLSVS